MGHLSQANSAPAEQSPSQSKPTVRASAKRIPSQVKATQPVPQKNVSRRSSKPIINWFQRKLAGTVKNKHLPDNPKAQGVTPRVGISPASRPPNRVTSSPLPINNSSQRLGNRQGAAAAAVIRRKTISLNGDDDFPDYTHRFESQDDRSSGRSSLARESIWSPASALEADEDASVRPIPPSGPPSPSPSRSSSSYMSDPRTFRSIAASTKPTTLLSIDLTPNGVAHIAQVPTTPQYNRFPPNVRTSTSNAAATAGGSGASVTFSALPPNSLQSSSRPSSLLNHGSLNSTTMGSHLMAPQTNGTISSIQAPLHTAHHPRNNPRPSSPPMDNASMLTLASSAFAIPGARVPATPGWSSAPPSALGHSDSLSHFGGSMTGEGYADMESTSQFVMGDDERLEERDVDASVRALRPRSSRRGSWDSDEASVWSAKGGPGTSSLARELSLWTTHSGRTGAQGDNDEPNDQLNEDPSHDLTSKSEMAATGNDSSRTDAATQPSDPVSDTEQDQNASDTEAPQYSASTVSVDTPTEVSAIDNSPAAQINVQEDKADVQSFSNADEWHSAPSTPTG